MPSLELAAGQVLTAAHTNTYWMRQAIATGLSSARPTGYEGRAVYDTDLDALNIYTTPTTGWKPPWNLPWGRVASAEATTPQAGIGTSLTNITGLSVTFTAVANRRYRLSAHMQVNPAAGPIAISIYMVDDTASAAIQTSSRVVSSYDDHSLIVAKSFTSGTRTIKLQGVASASTFTVEGAATQPTTLIVEDMGPSAPPA